MSDVNSLVLQGRIVRNAEILTSKAEGKVRVRFSIASNRSYKDADGNFVDSGNFFPVSVLLAKDAKIIGWLVKGQPIIIEGFVKQDRWEKEGVKHSATSIGIRKINLLFGSRQKQESDAENSMNGQDTDENAVFETDEYDNDTAWDDFPDDNA